jgi:hypothetical protein
MGMYELRRAHDSSESWVAVCSMDDRTWQAVVCSTCAETLGDTTPDPPNADA